MSDEQPILNADDAWSVLASALDPLPPPAGARDALLAAVVRATPYRTLLPRFAAVFDLTERAVHELLARMSEPGAWMAGAAGMLAFMDFRGGPQLGPAHCGVTRMKSGTRIPRHTHKAREITFVLRGELVDDEGNAYGAGQAVDAPAGSAHSLHILGEPDALLAVLVAEVEFDGTR